MASSYEQLVKALRVRSRNLCPGDICYICEEIHFLCSDKVMHDAAAAIEDLQARLGEAENSVERWKDMYLTKHEPKRGEFEKSIHEMFDSIWDCDINHPIFQDTVGELMEAVLQAYDTVNTAKMEVQDGK